MAETYEEIVQKWYMRMRSDFTGILMDKYGKSKMRLADAENIYQDIFVAIHDNIAAGRIGNDCDWRNYIIRVGLNMASKHYRTIRRHASLDEPIAPADGNAPGQGMERIMNILKELPAADGDDSNLYADPTANALLGNELEHTPEPCATIIRNTVFCNMSDAEIAAVVAPYSHNGKSIQVNAKAVKARRWLCLRDLTYRVKMALYNAGLISEKPINKTRNGKRSNG